MTSLIQVLILIKAVLKQVLMSSGCSLMRCMMSCSLLFPVSWHTGDVRKDDTAVHMSTFMYVSVCLLLNPCDNTISVN